ncbi:MAG: hypothetical protein WC678_01710 [Parcubacteria group bacterium]|jgi:hypothetical protein
MEENKAPHKIIKGLGYKYKEDQDGEYKNDDGSVLSKRLRVELTEK